MNKMYILKIADEHTEEDIMRILHNAGLRIFTLEKIRDSDLEEYGGYEE